MNEIYSRKNCRRSQKSARSRLKVESYLPRSKRKPQIRKEEKINRKGKRK
jgi:hypothetical protein